MIRRKKAAEKSIEVIVILVLLAIALFFTLGFLGKGYDFSKFFSNWGGSTLGDKSTLIDARSLNIYSTDPKNIDISAYTEDNWEGKGDKPKEKGYLKIEIVFDKPLDPDIITQNYIEAYINKHNGGVSARPSKQEEWMPINEFYPFIRGEGYTLEKEISFKIDPVDNKKLIIENIPGPDSGIDGLHYYLIRFDKTKFTSTSGVKINPNLAVLKFRA